LIGHYIRHFHTSSAIHAEASAIPETGIDCKKDETYAEEAAENMVE
jgi:hypothetical protein